MDRLAFTEADGPHFFKFILEDTLQEGKLMIPKKFVKNYGNSLSSPVTFEVLSGDKWEVELWKNEGEIWLDKGWKEFANHYSLEHGHIVFFKYKGDCHFNVLICDKSGLEIEYPDSDVDEEEFQKPDTDDKEDDENVDEDEDEGEGEGEGEGGNQFECEKTNGKGTKGASSLNTFRALETANNFKTEYPFFKKVVQSYHINHSNLNIPIHFFRNHFKNEIENVILQVADREWPVKMHFYEQAKVVLLNNGFAAFAKDNSLKGRDVCVFELVKSNVFHVSIFKSTS